MDTFCAVLAKKKVIKRGRGQNSKTYSEDSHQASLGLHGRGRKKKKRKGKKEIWIVRNRMNS